MTKDLNNSKHDLNKSIEEKKLLVHNENDTQGNEETNELNKKSFDELSIADKIKLLSFLVLALALLRIFTLDLIIMIGEFITAILVYFYSMWNNKCMAIVVLINGISGFIFSFIRIFTSLWAAKTESFSYLSVMAFIISIFATIVYGLILYFGHYGLKNFDMINFGKNKEKKNDHNNNDSMEKNVTSDYGAIGKNENDIHHDANNGKKVKEASKNENEENPLMNLGNKAKDIGNNLVHIGETVDQLSKNLNKL